MKNKPELDNVTAEKFAKYMNKYPKMYQELAETIKQNLPKKIGKNPIILDMGVGPGFLPMEINKLMPNAKVIGIDNSKNMIKLSKKEVEVVLSNSEKIPLKNKSTDVVVSRFSLCYWDPVSDGLKEINRVLKPGGRVILETLNREFPKWRLSLIKIHMFLNSAEKEVIRYHINSYSLAYSQDNIKEILKKSGFNILKIEGDKRDWKSLFIAEKKI